MPAPVRCANERVGRGVKENKVSRPEDDTRVELGA